MTDLLHRLVARYRSGAACAAALGISRQAFNAAMQRGSLSDNVALRAVDLLATPKDPPAPIISAAPDLACDSANNTNYASLDRPKKHHNNRGPFQNVHVITSESQSEAVDLIRWVLAVAKLPADSPRFNYYFSRWCVPDKVARAKAAGTFAESIRNCPPIDPAWVRLIPAAMAEYHAFTAAHQINTTDRPASSGQRPTAGKPRRRAA